MVGPIFLFDSSCPNGGNFPAVFNLLVTSHGSLFALNSWLQYIYNQFSVLDFLFQISGVDTVL